MNIYDLKRQAVRCAWLDLKGVIEAVEKGLPIDIDIDAIRLTLSELEHAFIDETADFVEQ